MTTMNCTFCLVEEEHHAQQCRRPWGGEDNKDSTRQRTPSWAKGRMAATMEDRSTTEGYEVIAPPLGLRPGRLPDTQQSAIGKGGGGGREENDDEDNSDGFLEEDGQGGGSSGKEEDGAMMTTMHCTLQLVEEEQCRADLFDFVAMAPLPILHWPLSDCCNGAIAVVVQAPLQLLHRCCHPCCTDVVAIVALVLLSSLRWPCHIIVLASSPTLSCWHCPCCCNGAIAVAQKDFLSLLRWHCLHHRAGILAIVALALLPSMRWQCHHCCVGVVPLLRWCLCHCCAGRGELKGTIFKLLDNGTYIIIKVALIFNGE
jgi:hypothetical protein